MLVNKERTEEGGVDLVYDIIHFGLIGSILLEGIALHCIHLGVAHISMQVDVGHDAQRIVH